MTQGSIRRDIPILRAIRNLFANPMMLQMVMLFFSCLPPNMSKKIFILPIGQQLRPSNEYPSYHGEGALLIVAWSLLVQSTGTQIRPARDVGLI